MPVAVFSIDGVSVPLLQEGIDDGQLPCLARLAREGQVALLAEDGPLALEAWAAFATGTPAEENLGLLDVPLRPGDPTSETMVSGDPSRPPFWKYVSDAGLTSVISSVEATQLLRPFRGIQALSWGMLDPYGEATPQLFEPPRVKEAIEQEVGSPRSMPSRAPHGPEETARLRDWLAGEIDRRRRGIALLMREPWDLLVAGMHEVHVAGHLLWPRSEEPAHGEALRAVYAAGDRALGSLIDLLPPDTTVVVQSPVGMGPSSVVGDPARSFLERGGWLVPRAKGGASREATHVSALRVARSAARRFAPQGLRRYRVARRLFPRSWLAQLAAGDVDWGRTNAFPLPSYPGASYVRVNLQGREPNGIVGPGAGYEEVCDAIATAARELVDEETGLPAAARVSILAETLGEAPGPVLPDLVIDWRADHRMRRLRSDSLGTIDVPETDQRSGNHTYPGFAVAHGPGIPAGSGRLDGPRARVVDLAPTILRLLGVTPPPSLRGRAIDVLCPSPADE
jgi:predicted AlkP superfamily phosphohydrolase/phosphomutase